uniref:Glycosyltransferase n=1 Tax=viral metagenome TaxID=1070528 RepID=A0A6C0JRU3_9ZZZZ
MWEFVDKIVYINLDHRSDRRDLMTKFFADVKIPLDKVVRFSAIKRTNGALGCLESHTEVLKLAKQNGWKNTLILEDDLESFHFEEGYDKLEELMKLPKWDVIMICGWYWKFDFPRIYSAANTGGYLVNENYIDTLLRNRAISVNALRRGVGFNFRNPKYNADVSWNSLQKTDLWYGVQPCLCRQVDGFSDIGNRVIKSSKVIGEGDRQIKKEVYG